VLEKIKSELYNSGAIYASMSGSGSSIYGIFKTKPAIIDSLSNYFTYIYNL
jgi:4-diphosphocytidyl-2-C-methyl-D-erythritol kinase